MTASTHDLLALTLLHAQAPGLAPEPIARRENDGRPAVAMGRLPGVALAGGPLSRVQVAGVADAMTRLHTAVPRTGLAGLPPGCWRSATPSETCARPTPGHLPRRTVTPS